MSSSLLPTPTVGNAFTCNTRNTHNTIGFNSWFSQIFAPLPPLLDLQICPPPFVRLLVFFCRQKSSLCGTTMVREELEEDGAAVRGADLPSFGLGELAAGEGSSWEGKMPTIGLAAGSVRGRWSRGGDGRGSPMAEAQGLGCAGEGSSWERKMTGIGCLLGLRRGRLVRVPGGGVAGVVGWESRGTVGVAVAGRKKLLVRERLGTS